MRASSGGGSSVDATGTTTPSAHFSARLQERIRAGGHDAEEILEELQTLTTQVHRLSERVDFTEKLVGSGQKPAAPAESPGPERGSGPRLNAFPRALIR